MQPVVPEVEHLHLPTQLKHALDLTELEYGIVPGLYFYGAFALCGLFFGPLADQLHRPWLIAAGLLVWTVLTASTIGPGTVIVCSKAGSDFGLALLWTLLAASFVAFTLQEAAQAQAPRITFPNPAVPAAAVLKQTCFFENVHVLVSA